MRSLITLALIACWLVSPRPANASNEQVATDPGTARPHPQEATLLLLRHALAPGVGDPAQFRIDDCSTQRNLNDQGREQSRAIGKALLAINYIPARIWSSQWCRATETAQLIAQTLRDAGHDVTVQALPYLNSTFRNRSEAAAQNQALRTFIGSLNPSSGPYLMVAHQVIISDLTGEWSNSGHGVWIDLADNPSSKWRVTPADTTQLAAPAFP